MDHYIIVSMTKEKSTQQSWDAPPGSKKDTENRVSFF